ncbi:MAG: hypothetical protein KJ011_05020 [Burkholderiaceae bacterium]|nr:hypothetical protein [Burkholderiaceae bacterium]
MRAIREFSAEFKCSVVVPSKLCTAISDWFVQHTQQGTQAIGALFMGAFYFDACFWPVEIPHGFGEYRLAALDSLSTMPKGLKVEVARAAEDYCRFARYWADCLDYGYGISDLDATKQLSPRAAAFLASGDRALRGAIAQLLTPRPNARAALGFREATEILLKALLVHEKGFNDRELKRRFQHRITDIAGACFDVTNQQEFATVAQLASVFPEVADRFDGVKHKLPEVWRAAAVTQVAATAVVRFYTDRDTRSQIEDQLRAIKPSI